MQLAPGLHRVGNDIIAAYLVEGDGGLTLIDAGVAGQYSDLLAELKAMGRSVTDIKGVVLTHGDSDHIGYAERLRSEHGIPVYVGEADAARARGEESSHPAWGKARIGATTGFLWYSMRKGGMRTKYLTEVIPVHDGDVLDLPGSPRIVALPGHSAGSIGIAVPAVDALFVGDAFTTRHVLTGKRGPQPAPFTDDQDAARESHAKLATVEARWVLPGHGPAWDRGTRELAAELARADATA
ncbi:MBL fold metallo-hydrolase [Humibacter sp.]|jgi:glyoxylase-like metal-dependent hydrolase (beta-lactamase superfamily II)|uniref:MBL fold metallo-hydrolase n=1 Tax=Humibacter sp. TaxID=1940291 RepID=UPI002BB02EB7|nr:MBL fold metallo-hydrolase [Humibacter sp.]HVX06364.1 MBL fold metallo-hydrolase [Humibacter sp.]